MRNVTVIGNGGWGTALAMVLRGAGHHVSVWGPFEEEITAIKAAGCNEVYLPGITLPEGITWTADVEEAAAGTDVAVLAVPTKFTRSVAENFRGRLSDDCRLVTVSKGFDPDTAELMTDLATEVLARPAAALSGPSHAEEVARGIPTAVVIGAKDEALAKELQEVFACPRFRVYTSMDVMGVQLGGALKNVIAVAVGVSDGLGFGDNTRAALITRGLAEITRLGVAMGAQQETFFGLSGMGDLIVTCTSRHSRNRGVGERLGQGEQIEDILASMQQVAEGIANCDLAQSVARKHEIDVPITDQVCAIVHHGISPAAAVEALLGRDFIAE